MLLRDQWRSLRGRLAGRDSHRHPVVLLHDHVSSHTHVYRRLGTKDTDEADTVLSYS